MPQSVINTDVTEDINDARTVIHTDPNMALNEFNSDKIRFGRRPRVIENDTLPCLGFQLELN